MCLEFRHVLFRSDRSSHARTNCHASLRINPPLGTGFRQSGRIPHLPFMLPQLNRVIARAPRGLRREEGQYAMKFSTRLGTLTAAVVLVMNAPAALAAPASVASGETSAVAPNAVTNWNRIAITALLAFPPAAGAPPALQIDMAMLHGAVYDAINSIEPRHAPYLLETRFGSSASKEAAATTAAYRVLSSIVSTVPPRIAFPNRADLLAVLDTEYEASLAAIPEGQSKAEGIAAGDAAAEAMIAARENDGRFG